MLINNAKTNNKIYINKATFNKPKTSPKNLSTCLMIGIEVMPLANNLSKKKTIIEPKNKAMKEITNKANDRINGAIASTMLAAAAFGSIELITQSTMKSGKLMFCKAARKLVSVISVTAIPISSSLENKYSLMFVSKVGPIQGLITLENGLASKIEAINPKIEDAISIIFSRKPFFQPMTINNMTTATITTSNIPKKPKSIKSSPIYWYIPNNPYTRKSFL